MLELAQKKNSIPLPQIPEKFGLRLPAERLTLTAPQVKIIKKSNSTVQELENSINQNTFAISGMPTIPGMPGMSTIPNTRKIQVEDDDFDMED